MSYYSYTCQQMDTAARFGGHRCPPFVGAAPTPDEIAAARREWPDSSGAVTVTVADNGEMGDGLCLSFHLETRDRTNRDPFANALFAVELTPDQAETIAEALMGAVRMRRMDCRQSESERARRAEETQG